MFGCEVRRALAVVLLALAATFPGAALATRPGYHGDLPDPFVYRAGPTFLAIGTSTAGSK